MKYLVVVVVAVGVAAEEEAVKEEEGVVDEEGVLNVQEKMAQR